MSKNQKAASQKVASRKTSSRKAPAQKATGRKAANGKAAVRKAAPASVERRRQRPGHVLSGTTGRSSAAKPLQRNCLGWLTRGAEP